MQMFQAPVNKSAVAKEPRLPKVHFLTPKDQRPNKTSDRNPCQNEGLKLCVLPRQPRAVVPAALPISD